MGHARHWVRRLHRWDPEHLAHAALGLVGGLGALGLLAAMTFTDVPTPSPAQNSPADISAEALPGTVEPPADAWGHGTDGHQPYLTWASEWGPRTGIPARALAAYATADAALDEESPSCRLNWATLAGIGWVESAHGTDDGARLDQTGVASPSIIGPTLDGTQFSEVPDTDGGALDGNARWDHAVGPLQLTPESWTRWSADGDADGVENPHDIDDAALSAARYLCASGADLSTGEGWSDAVFSYNHSTDYVQQVRAAAETYAARSR